MNTAVKSASKPENSSAFLDGGEFEEEEVLVIIDMQGFFPASCDANTLSAVEQEIRRAIESDRPVVIVEYDPNEIGSTHAVLMKHLKGYHRLAVVSKDAADGSSEVLEACLDHGFWPGRLRICGVNSDACILETVTGYLERVRTASISVVKKACNCLTGPTNDVWTSDFPRIHGVVVV